jgi:hypothetical protein
MYICCSGYFKVKFINRCSLIYIVVGDAALQKLIHRTPTAKISKEKENSKKDQQKADKNKLQIVLTMSTDVDVILKPYFLIIISLSPL